MGRTCLSCHRQKRRCDKATPKCGLCSRLKRPCDYSWTLADRDSEDIRALKHEIDQLKRQLEAKDHQCRHHGLNSKEQPLDKISSHRIPLAESSPEDADPLVPGDVAAFPVGFFLDFELFIRRKSPVIRPSMSVSNCILRLIGPEPEAQAILRAYFMTIHTWMPFISKKRAEHSLMSDGLEGPADFVLLLLCMKLVTTLPNDSARATLYSAAKSMLMAVEERGLLTLRVVQAGILLTVYELGHAILPSAFLSVSHCISLAHAAGLHRQTASTPILGRGSSYGESEERRRVYWATLVLERVIHAGNRDLPLTTEDPPKETFLPCDDNSWDAGEMCPNPPLILLTSTPSPASPFALLCQSSHLLGLVLRHHHPGPSNLGHSDNEFRYREARQLIGILHSLLLALLSQSDHGDYDVLSVHAAIAICYSALILLYGLHSCTDYFIFGTTPQQLELQGEAINGLKNAAGDVLKFVEIVNEKLRVRRGGGEEEEEGAAQEWQMVSPFVCHSLYLTGFVLAWMIRENGMNEEFRFTLARIREVLGKIGERWGAGEAYLKILEGQENDCYSS